PVDDVGALAVIERSVPPVRPVREPSHSTRDAVECQLLNTGVLGCVRHASSLCGPPSPQSHIACVTVASRHDKLLTLGGYPRKGATVHPLHAGSARPVRRGLRLGLAGLLQLAGLERPRDPVVDADRDGDLRRRLVRAAARDARRARRVDGEPQVPTDRTDRKSTACRRRRLRPAAGSMRRYARSRRTPPAVPTPISTCSTSPVRTGSTSTSRTRPPTRPAA